MLFVIILNAPLTLSSTVGAGDTFIAGMLYALTCHNEDWNLARKLRFANKLAGIKVLQEGFHGFAGKVLIAPDAETCC